jgi:hypothetical protein
MTTRCRLAWLSALAVVALAVPVIMRAAVVPAAQRAVQAYFSADPRIQIAFVRWRPSLRHGVWVHFRDSGDDQLTMAHWYMLPRGKVVAGY